MSLPTGMIVPGRVFLPGGASMTSIDPIPTFLSLKPFKLKIALIDRSEKDTAGFGDDNDDDFIQNTSYILFNSKTEEMSNLLR